MDYELTRVFEELNTLYEANEHGTSEGQDLEEEIDLEITDDTDDIVDNVEDTDENGVLPSPSAEADQAVLECLSCGGICIKSKADIKLDTDTQLVNIDEPCPYCEATQGYKILGNLIPESISDTTDIDNLPIVDSSEKATEEDIEEACEK